MLRETGVDSELVYIKSEGDVDTTTPLYELGVQGIFTKALDIALLNNRIDLAVHSMKDVPTRPANHLVQTAVLKRGNHLDLLVFKEQDTFLDLASVATVATSSVRRAAQWLKKYPNHSIENIRGNVNTRMRKFNDSNLDGVIFAAAGLERINLRPENSVELDWMLPAPAQGAIVILCRENDEEVIRFCRQLNDDDSELVTGIEKDFLRTLAGGCSTPISALARIKNDQVYFEGNICSLDGTQLVPISVSAKRDVAASLGVMAGEQLLALDQVKVIIQEIRNV